MSNKTIVAISVLIIILITLINYWLISVPESAPEIGIESEEEEDYEITKEEAARRLLAEKHDRKTSEITININQETMNYVKGGVVFQPGGSENSAIFLMARTDNGWELVFDGQGAVPCPVVEPYNFPVNIVSECLGESGELKDKIGEACINSGGKVALSLCCKSSGDYPNLCLVGSCGCSPEDSHQVKICDCGPAECFNGLSCVEGI